MGKVLELTGTVDRAHQDDEGEGGFLTLTNANGAIYACECVVSDRMIGEKLGRGQTVRVKGRFTSGLFVTSRLDPCEILESGPPMLIRVTAEQLASAYTADQKAFEAKYGDHRTLLVSGEVAAIEKRDGQIRMITLKGDSQTKIGCFCSRLFPNEFATGTKVKLRAEYTWRAERGTLFLYLEDVLDAD